MTLRGRHWFFLWLVLFLGTALAVATRQRKALDTARRLGELQTRRIQLEAQKTELQRQIDLATSREVLVPRMERAGFHLPTDKENPLVAPDSLTTSGGRKR